jgi:hypothetical protein
MLRDLLGCKLLWGYFKEYMRYDRGANPVASRYQTPSGANRKSGELYNI